MTRLEITVNGRPVSADVEPRTRLADFLRETLLLTGTHLGCEHGVCGACTVLLDDEPVRSCLTYAALCDGAAVREAIEPETDLHASSDYRRHLAGVLTGRALTAAWRRAQGPRAGAT